MEGAWKHPAITLLQTGSTYLIQELVMLCSPGLIVWFSLGDAPEPMINSTLATIGNSPPKKKKKGVGGVLNRGRFGIHRAADVSASSRGGFGVSSHLAASVWTDRLDPGTGEAL